MSDCWKCDKCGQYHTKDDGETRVYIRTEPDEYALPSSPIKTKDLCEACHRRFAQWLCDHPQYYGSKYLFFAIDEWPVYSSKDSLPYGWPVFEDGTPIKEWDEVLDQYGHGFVAHSFHHYDDKWWCVASGHGYAVRSSPGVFKRPTKEQMADYYKKWPDEREKANAKAPHENPFVGLVRGKHWERHEASDYYCGRCGWKVTDHDSYCPECGGALHGGCI